MHGTLWLLTQGETRKTKRVRLSSYPAGSPRTSHVSQDCPLLATDERQVADDVCRNRSDAEPGVALYRRVNVDGGGQPSEGAVDPRMVRSRRAAVENSQPVDKHFNQRERRTVGCAALVNDAPRVIDVSLAQVHCWDAGLKDLRQSKDVSA
jgi:hypothetical protein